MDGVIPQGAVDAAVSDLLSERGKDIHRIAKLGWEQDEQFLWLKDVTVTEDDFWEDDVPYYEIVAEIQEIEYGPKEDVVASRMLPDTLDVVTEFVLTELYPPRLLDRQPVLTKWTRDEPPYEVNVLWEREE